MSERPYNPSMVTEQLPELCANGHRLVGGHMIVGWMPCLCYPGRVGHRTVECRECGSVWSKPPHTDITRSALWWK